ncbi:DUF4145 domain-containing protein [Microbacterium sp. NPDC055599]
MATLDLADFYRGVHRMYGRVMTAQADHTCPHCKKITHMVYVEDSVRWIDERSRRVEAAFQCTACHRFVIGGTTQIGVLDAVDGVQTSVSHAHPQMRRTELAMLLQQGVQYWEPIAPVGMEYHDILPEIAAPADEAHRCLSIGAHRAAVLMARAVIEATAKSKGVTERGLFAKIEAMGTSQLIRPQIVQAAHAIRLLGNDMAHGDFATTAVTEQDAADVLLLMDEVLNDVFAVTDRLKRLLARHETDK